MKKVTLLVSEKEKDKFILYLQKEGVLHIKHVQNPVHHEISFLEEKIAKLEKAEDILSLYAARKEKDGVTQNLPETTAQIIEAWQEKEFLKTEDAAIRKKMRLFEILGEFNPEDITSLKEKRVKIRFYRLQKEEFEKLKKDNRCRILKKEKGYVYVAAVSWDSELKIEGEEFLPPSDSPGKMRDRIHKINSRINEIEDYFREEAKNLAGIRKCAEEMKKKERVLKVKFGMKGEGNFAYLQGFCPRRTASKITSLANRCGAGYIIENPDNPEETPTLITNPKWVRAIAPVFDFMNVWPGYNEFDISFYFLIFFSLFFAMLIGDAGYGLIFLLAAFFARKKLKTASQEPFFLMYILSGATIIWGAAQGIWFGSVQRGAVPFLNNSDRNIIYVCFLIGAVHLTIAHILRGIRILNSVKVLTDLGWIMVLWGMFFAAGKFVLGNVFPIYAGWFLITGIILVLLFSNPEKGMLKGILVSLGEIPLSVISSFSDIVSYLRLFAVGYATVVVAQSFNTIAIAAGVKGPIAALGAAVILVLGHLLNIALGLMGVIVHGIRLNMLEFSGHLGMQWTGKKYEPFRI